MLASNVIYQVYMCPSAVALLTGQLSGMKQDERQMGWHVASSKQQGPQVGPEPWVTATRTKTWDAYSTN